MTEHLASAGMDAYTLERGCQVQSSLASTGERFDLSFEAGTVTPKNEAEEAALEHLASLGLARKTKPKKTEE